MSNTAQTSTENTTYNLVSVLYHALEGSVTYRRYAQDAQSDPELERYFTQAAEQTDRSAEEAKRLLKSRI